MWAGSVGREWGEGERKITDLIHSQGVRLCVSKYLFQSF